MLGRTPEVKPFVRVCMVPATFLLVGLPALDGLTLGGWSGIPSGWPTRR